MINFRTLRSDEIDVRVGTCNANGFSLLLYKDARVDMNILDETFDSYWQRDHKELKGNIYCGIGIYFPSLNQWIWKWDCGSESFSDKEKGEASDSFKRAAFNWGIGRELYTAPFIWINGNVKEVGGRYVPTLKGIKVSLIEYNQNKEITKLVITNNNEEIFVYPEEAKQEHKYAKMISDKQLAYIRSLKLDEKKVCDYYQVNCLEELTAAMAFQVIKMKGDPDEV